MKKDTLSFLSAVLSIPLILTGIAVTHEATAVSEAVVRDQPLYVDSVPLVEETPPTVAVAVVPPPIVKKPTTPVVPAPLPTPTPAPTPTPSVQSAPTKIVKVVKPTRRTRAS